VLDVVTSSQSVNWKRRIRMFRSGLIALTALGLIAAAASAQGKMDCGAAYKGFLAKYHGGKKLQVTRLTKLRT
jgi:hypothetical protein